MQAVDEARQACDNAASLLGTTPYQYDQKYMSLQAPLSSATQKAVTLPQPGEVNPNAILVLEAADERLAKAIGEAGGVANGSVISLGNEMLGHVKMLKGAYYARTLAAGTDKLQAAQEAALGMLFDLGLNKKLLDDYAHGLQAGDDNVDTLLKAAKAEFDAKTAQIADVDGQIKDLAANKDGLSKENEALTSAARSLFMESKAAGGKAAQDKFDQAQAKESQANANASRIRDIEQRTEDLLGQKRTLELDQAGAKRKQDALQQALNGGKTAREALTGPRDAAQQAVSKGQDALKAAFDALTRDYQAWADQGEKAIKCHTEAAKKFQEARGGEHAPVTDATAPLAGDEAYAVLARANDQGSMASTLASLDALVKHVKAQAPTVADTLALGSSATYIEAAMRDYADAAEKYNAASAAANPQARWTYDVMRADALLNRYRFSHDHHNRDDADELLAKCAAQAKPYEGTAEIAGLARLQKAVPPPATEPAAPAPEDTGK
jgi:hypothetical protein